MARRKKEDLGQVELGAAEVRAPIAPEQRSEVVEYQPVSTEGRWRVERWEMLAAEFEFGAGSAEQGARRAVEAAMPVVHESLRRHARSWLIVRRLFGVMPVMMDLNGSPDDFRVWPREELAGALGIGNEELKAELMMARAILERGAGRGEEKAVAGPEWAPNAAGGVGLGLRVGGKETLAPPTDDEYLKEMGYAPRMFEISVRSRTGGEPLTRPKEENEMEKKWFASRVRQFEKVLKDRMVSRLADQVLRNELRLRRVEEELTGGGIVIGTSDYESLMKTKADLEKIFERQLAQLNEQAPWFNATEKEMAARDAFSEVVRAIQEYQGRGDTRLINGLFTAFEMQVMTRTAQQKPLPDYRWGWHLYMLESREFLWDPRGQSRFRQPDLAKLDRAFKEALRQVVEETGEHVPDLMQEGADGEYQDLYIPEEKSEDLEKSEERNPKPEGMAND